MKVLHIVLLVAVALEAGLAMWPESFSAAAEDTKTVVVKPARKGKSPKKVRRTIRVRETSPPAPPSPVSSVPAVSPQLAPPANPTPISNEVNVKPDISVHVAPHQDQQQQPQSQPPVVHIQTPVQPELVQKPQPQPQLVQQQPIIELPDDDDDEEDRTRDEDDDDERQVAAATNDLQIVPYEQKPIVSVASPADKLEQLRPQLQIVPHNNPATQLIEASGSQQLADKFLMKPATNLLTHPLETILTTPTTLINRSKLIDTEVVHPDGAELLTYPAKNILDANTVNRYTSPGVPSYRPNFASPLQQAYAAAGAQVPMIPVTYDQQPAWSMAASATLLQSPFAAAAAPLAALQPAMAATPYLAAATPSLYSASPAGATFSPVAGLYQPAATVYPAAGLVGRGYYGSGPIVNQQALVAAQAPLMMPAAATMVQQQPPQVLPMMMQPVTVMQPIMQQPFSYQMKEMKKKRKPKKKQQQVVVDIEEPAVEEKTTWVKKEPQFNQYVEEKPATTTKIVEVTKEEPDEIEWETVRIPKVRKNAATAAAAGQQ